LIQKLTYKKKLRKWHILRFTSYEIIAIFELLRTAPCRSFYNKKIENTKNSQKFYRSTCITLQNIKNGRSTRKKSRV